MTTTSKDEQIAVLQSEVLSLKSEVIVLKSLIKELFDVSLLQTTALGKLGKTMGIHVVDEKTKADLVEYINAMEKLLEKYLSLSGK